jgi:uncharacterized protein YecE (DUF72 family)
MLWHAGTIGFSYPDWVGTFYPPRTKSADFLANYARAFSVVELDTTFHGIPPIERVKHWAEQVPNHFLFCPKTPRSITHESALSVAKKDFQMFLHVIRHFGHKLGPIVLQFPPSYSIRESTHLASMIKEFPADLRFAIELRNSSWQTPAIFDLFHAANIAWIWADYNTPTLPFRPTADFAYLRFIGVHHQYETHTHERFDPTPRLLAQIRQIDLHRRHLNTVFALFTNDYAGHSPTTANRLRSLLGQPPAAIAEPQPSLF